jgi:hypothetical protein
LHILFFFFFGKCFTLLFDFLRYHGKASDDDIKKVLYSNSKDGEVRVIFATSTAETALTIEGLTIVIDTGVYLFLSHTSLSLMKNQNERKHL